MLEFTQKRLLAFSDIHGHLEPLKTLLNKVIPQIEDDIIFLGDYVNNGPNSRDVIDLLLQFQLKFPKTIFLKGNHEQLFLKYLETKDKRDLLCNGGYKTIKDYTNNGVIDIPTDHLSFFKSLRLVHETQDFIFVHAGLKPELEIGENDEHSLLWIRDEFIASNYEWEKTVVFGHTPFAALFIKNKRIGLNTDIQGIGSITCCDVITLKCWDSHA